ncbi:MAG: von Willebrand factor type A domain-containing protein [Deltaproteobacteria bacterium]|nr:von Willebrand factor type A domain-containing protein [Deltaproteobacteria bacterium]
MSPGAIGLRRARRAGAVAVLACGCATGLDPLERRVEDLDRRAGEMSAQVERAARDAALASRAADSAAADARAAAARAEDSSSVSRRVLSPAAPLPAHEVARGADSRARSRLAGSALRRERTQAAPLSLDDLAVVGSRPYADVFFEHYGVNPTIDTAEEPTSSFSVDVDTASYALARSYLERGELPPAEAIRVEELVNAFDYGYSTQQGAVFTVHGELAPSPTRPGYHVLDLAIRTPPVEDRARKPANLVFVIDVSGSMSLDDRLGRVKRSLRLLVDRLAPSDTIGVVVYGDRGRDVLEPAPWPSGSGSSPRSTRSGPRDRPTPRRDSSSATRWPSGTCAPAPPTGWCCARMVSRTTAWPPRRRRSSSGFGAHAARGSRCRRSASAWATTTTC